ncbi:MAG: hypothetical protein AB8B87_12280 [Granulosicoccus sp.]
MSLIIALPRERRPSERRVALDPSRVERLIQSGLQVRIEAECGLHASFHDDDYQGATVHDSFAEVVRGADIVVKVVCPTLEEIAELQAGSVLLCIMSAFQHKEEVEALARRGVTVLAMDHMPRTTRAQPMDALSSQATVAGYKAALLAAELSPRMFPMLTTAAGTIRPSRVLVIGAGVAGLQAIATARRLGAQVEGYDIRRAAKEQIESLGARMVDTGVEVEGAGGFARALRKDEKQKQHDVLAEHLARAHVVICAASIPGRRAPQIITEDMVDGMLPESVIVDLAASTGGNCELTHVGEHYYHHETLIVGPLNLPSHGAVHASEMYGRNVYNMLQLVIRADEVVLDPDDDIIARCVVCHDGCINHGPTASLLDIEHVAFGGAVHAAADFPDQSAGWLAEPDEQAELPEAQQESENPENSSASADGHSETADQTQTGVAGDNESGMQSPAEPSQSLRSDADAGKHQDPAQLDELHDAEQQNDLLKLDGVSVASEDSVPDEPPADDLTRIEGVGPALQECLYSFGFKRYSDIASLDDEGVQKLTVQLALEDEVEKQDWTGQARKLMVENSG